MLVGLYGFIMADHVNATPYNVIDNGKKVNFSLEAGCPSNEESG
jgi:hypothetical protein